MFNSIFDTSATGLSFENALICAGVALVLGIVVAFTHMKTSSTTKGFLITLATLPLLVMAVMIMINGNLGTSIAILGAFSLIRFRSIQGNAKELLSIFFVMMIGLALGMGHVLFSFGAAGKSYFGGLSGFESLAGRGNPSAADAAHCQDRFG